MNEEDKVTEPETDQKQSEQEQEQITNQIKKLEHMNQNLLIQQHVDDVDDSKLFSIFNRYNRKR